MNDERSRIADVMSAEIAKTVLTLVSNYAQHNTLTQADAAVLAMLVMDMSCAKLINAMLPPSARDATAATHYSSVVNMLRNAPAEDSGLHMPEPVFEGQKH